ncbi:MAG: outer membrane beta-barrel protein [Rikenellaceae bacterium]
MTKAYLSLIFILLSFNVSAQVCITTSGKSNEHKNVIFVDVIGYKITSENSNAEIIKLHQAPRYKGHIAFLEFGFNNFTSPKYNKATMKDEPIDLNMARSIYVGWNIVTFSTALNRSNTLGISTAFGFVWRNFVFDNDITLKNIDGMLHATPIDPSYKKSKYNTFSINIPVVLEYTKKDFFVAAGLYADILVSSQTKIKSPEEKHKGDLYSNPIGAGVTARVGYKRFYAFGNYGFVNVFDADRAATVKPWTIGIGLGF